MRHRKRGRTLGRSPSHRKALLRNLASNLFLTERDATDEPNEPKVKGRIVTTLQKAKEVRPFVERCVSIACRSLQAEEEAQQYATDADRGSDEWRSWRTSQEWQKWNQAIAPAVTARRRILRLIRDKQAMQVLFNDIAPRFVDRHGGYTRIMRLATPRLGDAGTRAILEFVGTRDRVIERSEKPTFADDEQSNVDESSDSNDASASADEVSDDAAGDDQQAVADDEQQDRGSEA